MNTQSMRLLPLALAVALAACSQAPETAPLSPSEPPATDVADPVPAATEGDTEASSLDALLSQSLAGEHRSEEHRARDQWRNPAQTLAFFGLRPDATVIEVTPGGGWYTQVLAPVLRGHGQLVTAVIDPASAANERSRDYYTRANEGFRNLLAEAPTVYDQVRVHEFAVSEPRFGDDNSADLVLTFRNVHNWVGSGAAPGMFEGFFDVLKPGGVLGVVEHSVAADSAGERPDSGYMTEQAVIDLATAAGFELAARSDINANPADAGDHPNGVWNLPPSLRVAEGEEAARYEAIGESNRMTLKFVKPHGDVILRQGMDNPDGSPD
ncbi:MAG: methyltransferase [Xanthomonadales bacterium]|nr:methyltransferase [Xanthomonadales bacterium]